MIQIYLDCNWKDIMKRFYLLTALFALTAAGCVKVDLVDAISPSLKI